MPTEGQKKFPDSSQASKIWVSGLEEQQHRQKRRQRRPRPRLRRLRRPRPHRQRWSIKKNTKKVRKLCLSTTLPKLMTLWRLMTSYQTNAPTMGKMSHSSSVWTSLRSTARSVEIAIIDILNGNQGSVQMYRTIHIQGVRYIMYMQISYDIRSSSKSEFLNSKFICY